jgi:hypothetical protein
MFPDLRNNLKTSGSSLYQCSISCSTLKLSFAPRILTITSKLPRGPATVSSPERQAAQERILKNPVIGGCIVAEGTGLGKTRQTAAALALTVEEFAAGEKGIHCQHL